MNKRPIESARDPDLRLSERAIQRAARRAHELARKTGTEIVISRGGVVEYLKPEPSEPAGVQEPTPHYRNEQ